MVNIIKNILLIVIIGIISYIAYNLYEQNKELEEKLDRATYVPTEQVTTTKYFEDEMDMKKDDAKDTVVIIEKAQENKIPPSTSITVQAPTPQQAATIVTEKIQNNDKDLPEEFTEEADKTIVTEQPKNEDYQVGVYKINNYKNWSAGVGVGTFDGDTYVPVTISRQLSKEKSIDFQINLDPDKGLKPNGFQIGMNWHF